MTSTSMWISCLSFLVATIFKLKLTHWIARKIFIYANVTMFILLVTNSLLKFISNRDPQMAFFSVISELLWFSFSSKTAWIPSPAIVFTLFSSHIYNIHRQSRIGSGWLQQPWVSLVPWNIAAINKQYAVCLTRIML